MNYQFFNINILITIADNLQFTVCNSIHIEQSVETPTNTAKIELPREFRNAVNPAGKEIDISGKSILDFIKRGDKIKIELGYDGDLQTEFIGYITKIGADAPLIIECEDEMSRLKTFPKITKTITSGKITDILTAVIPAQYIVECDESYGVGQWIIKNATPYEVLQELREKAYLRAYFKDEKTLHVGMIADFKPQTVHEFNFSTNIRRGSDLKFEQKQDNPKYVTVTSRQANGEDFTYSVGEKGGDETTVNLMQNLSREQLKIWGDKLYENRSFNGFQGTLDGWLLPRTKAGDSADIKRPYYPDRHQDGRYFIEAVTIDVNAQDGIKRANKLSYKL